jgi:hypothetical protein
LIVRALILISCLLHGEREQTGEGDGQYEILFSALIYGQERDLLQKRKIPCLCFGEDTGRGENEKKHVVIFDMLTYVSEGKILHFLQFFMVFF